MTEETDGGRVDRPVSCIAKKVQSELLAYFADLADEMGIDDVAEELSEHAK